VTDLRQSHEHGALVRRTLKNNTVTQETLTRLPAWIDKESEATLLSRTSDDGQEVEEKVRILLNRATAPFKKYKTSDPPFVPALLERESHTIPSLVSHGSRLLEDGADMSRLIEAD